MRRVIFVVIVLVGCGSEQGHQLQAQRGMPAPAAIPDDVTYSVIDTQIVPDIKRSVIVRLNKRVTKDVLRAIAVKLKAEDPRTYQRTFISYLLPGMPVNAGSWASTHFNPTLEIKIYGTTTAEHHQLLKAAESTPPPGMMGRWTASDRTGFPGIMTLLQEGDAIFMLYRFQDGNEARYDYTVRNVDGQDRYAQKGRNTSDYLVILPNGDLGHCDDEGLWATSTRIR